MGLMSPFTPGSSLPPPFLLHRTGREHAGDCRGLLQLSGVRSSHTTLLESVGQWTRSIQDTKAGWGEVPGLPPVCCATRATSFSSSINWANNGCPPRFWDKSGEPKEVGLLGKQQAAVPVCMHVCAHTHTHTHKHTHSQERKVQGAELIVLFTVVSPVLGT